MRPKLGPLDPSRRDAKTCCPALEAAKRCLSTCFACHAMAVASNSRDLHLDGRYLCHCHCDARRITRPLPSRVIVVLHCNRKVPFPSFCSSPGRQQERHAVAGCGSVRLEVPRAWSPPRPLPQQYTVATLCPPTTATAQRRGHKTALFTCTPLTCEPRKGIHTRFSHCIHANKSTIGHRASVLLQQCLAQRLRWPPTPHPRRAPVCCLLTSGRCAAIAQSFNRKKEPKCKNQQQP